MTDPRTPTSDPQPVELGRWYPDMPPGLPGETDEQYTNRLTGADGTNRRPYDHPRFRQCSIGYHDECSRLRTGDEGCQCPCHSETPTSDPVAEPQTEAGRRLLALDVFDTASMDDEDFRRVILAIEAEARQQARAAFAAQVAALREALERIAVGCEASEWANDAVNVWDACMDPNYIEGEPTVRCSGCEAHFALLAASPEPASPEAPGSGLDVEHLTAAFHAESCSPHGHPVEYDRPLIEKVVATYDRLAARPDGAEADAAPVKRKRKRIDWSNVVVDEGDEAP